jgi:hypothetical protein
MHDEGGIRLQPRTPEPAHLLDRLRKDLPQLIAHRAASSLTLYVPLPGDQIQAKRHRIVLKNLLKQTRNLVTDDTHQLLENHFERLERSKLRGSGMVVFHDPEATRSYALPAAVERQVSVSDQFQLRPVLALLSEARRFWILAISRNAVRVLLSEWNGVRRVEPPRHMPRSLSDSLATDGGEKQLQWHTGASKMAIYHGHGLGERRTDEDLRRYLAAVDSGLEQTLRDGTAPPPDPVVLAGVRDLTSRLQMLSKNEQIVEEFVEGNPDQWSDLELVERAAPIATRVLESRRRATRRRAKQLAHTRFVSFGVPDTVAAALAGRVDTLFIAKGQRRWGKVWTPPPKAAPPGPVDLLDLAAIRTYELGGQVFMLNTEEMPDERAPISALLRH